MSSSREQYLIFVIITLAFAAMPILLWLVVWLQTPSRPDSWLDPLVVVPALGGLFVERWVPVLSPGFRGVLSQALSAYAMVMLLVLMATFVFGSPLAGVCGYGTWAICMGYVSIHYLRKAKSALDEEGARKPDPDTTEP